LNSTLVPAVVAGLVALVVAVITTVAGFYVQRDKLRQELRTEFMAEQAIVQLLNHSTWNLRSFQTIRRHVGGFEDDELRRLLVRSGALRFTGKDGSEVWGLRERNKHLLE
jgi:hypothetical protein